MSKIERIKAETDGLDVLPELLRAARDGWETLDPEHVGLLKWYGLYAHNTADGHFMMRVKVIQGKLSAAQVETMAGIAEEFGRGVIDCTTRQCFQIHWIRLENIPEIFERLERVGMTTSGACGDITRNVVGCTLAGLAHDEVVDGYATAEAIHEYFLDNKLYSNLPRKYKISVTGCREDCARGLINDIALSGAIAEDGTRGFNLRVGGGLSTQPRFARWMDVFVTPEEAPEVIAGMTGIFRDAEENRKARGKARLKFLVDRVGPEALREELEQRVGRPLQRGVPKAPGLSRRGPHRRPPPGRRHPPHGRPRRPGRAPEGLPAARARRSWPASTAATTTTPCASPTSRTSCCRGSRSDNVDALLAEPLIARPHPHPHALPARPADLHRQGVLRPGQGPHQEPRGGDRQVPRRAREPRTATARTSACTSRAARRAARSTRSPTSASRACSRRSTASSSRRWTSGSAAGSARTRSSATSCVKKVPNWDLNETLLRIFTPLRDPPRRRRDVPRLRGPHRARRGGRSELTPVEEPVA